MKFSIQPINGFSRYCYYGGVPLLVFCWLDHWLQLFLLSDLLRVQLFIVSIIIIAIAAILNLSGFLISMYSDSDNPSNKSNPSDDH